MEDSADELEAGGVSGYAEKRNISSYFREWKPNFPVVEPVRDTATAISIGDSTFSKFSLPVRADGHQCLVLVSSSLLPFTASQFCIGNYWSQAVFVKQKRYSVFRFTTNVQ
jgi:hypothetical protein